MDLARCYGQAPVPVSDISKRQGISVKFVEQVIRPLKKAELIKSVRGPKGGHYLAKQPQDITVGQIIRLLETHSELAKCVTHPEQCLRSDDCRVRLVWTEATQLLYTYLDRITIADLISISVNTLIEKEICLPFLEPEKNKSRAG